MEKSDDIKANTAIGILIHYCKSGNQFRISSKHPMLKNEYVKISVNGNCLAISVPTLDYVGKAYKPQTITRNGWRQVAVRNKLLKTGRFEIDTEESTEDELVVYYR